MLTVGVLARRFGLTRSTLLYYDRLGLLRPSGRSRAGYRSYAQADERRLELICTYRRAGLSLRAIARVLDGGGGGLVPALERRLEELDEEVENLRAQQRVVAGLLQNPAMAKRGARVLDKRTLVGLLRAAGMSEEDMDLWHRNFERSAPDQHGRFLELLGLPPEEIAAIRALGKARPARR